MIHVRYSKKDMAAMIRKAIHSQKMGQLTPLDLQTFLDDIAEALDGSYVRLWNAAKKWVGRVGVAPNGEVFEDLKKS